MRVSTEGYGLLTESAHAVADRCDAALGFVLEGGYGLDTLSESVRMVNKVFDGYQPARDDEDEVNDAALGVLESVRGLDVPGLE
jgi:acetoin utilization deacetylase AcuC-like enzyme